MKSKRVVFIEPAANKINVFDKYMRLPLMGTLYLGTILHNHGYEVRILNENFLAKLIDPFEVHADVFCITALTVSANRARLLASQLKRIYPDSTVIVGGIHASLLPEEFTDIADHVVIGEAEDIIVDILEKKFTDTIIRGSKVADLDNLPLINYGLLEGADTMRIIPIMTSRGCPFDCNFCTVTKIFGRKFRIQSARRILAEIENALNFFDRTNFFFYDDNFSANKKRIHELCDMLSEQNLRFCMTAQVRSDLAHDQELVRKMVNAGLRWVYIGFESIDDETLKALHKSQTKSDIQNAITCFHEFGVNIHGMFMFGEDHDTVENITRTVEFAIKHDIDTVQFMILTPLPGTQLYDVMLKENRLIHTNWDYYNGMYVVFQPRNMSGTRLMNETYAAYKKFYSLRRTILDSLSLLFNVSMDALVWNFENINRYNLDYLFIRAGAKTIVTKGYDMHDSYLKYMHELERKC